VQETASPIKTWPDKSKRFALVIGVDEYEDPQINKLEGAGNDARALAAALKRYAGFPEDQVILIAPDQPPDRRPTRGNILRRISNLQGLVPQDGLLVVSFAGHGIEKNGRGFLCPTDAQISGDIKLLEETAIAVDDVREWIHQTGVKQVVIILDACRSNPSGRGISENRLTQSYANRFNFDVRNREVNAFATFYATNVGSVAYEYKEKKQGYFTWALVDGIKGAAANEKGEVTLAGLKKYLEDTVPKRVALDLGQGKEQRPMAAIEGYKADELVISYTVKAPIAPAGPSGRVDPAAVELSFWDSIKNSRDPADFREYLNKYPEGQFAGLARNKLKSLGNAAKSEERPAVERARVAPYTFEGTWINKDANTGGYTRLEIARIDTRLMVHVWGKCHPECDLGAHEGAISDETGSVAWNDELGTVKMTLILQGPDLQVFAHRAFLAANKPKQQSYELFKKTASKTAERPAIEWPPVAPDSFQGTWINSDPNTRGWTKLEIVQKGLQLLVHVWGKCHPTDCDDGVHAGSLSGLTGNIKWKDLAARRMMTLTLQGSSLQAVTENIYGDNQSGRKSVDLFRRQ
jgi:hypothetical protein